VFIGGTRLGRRCGIPQKTNNSKIATWEEETIWPALDPGDAPQNLPALLHICGQMNAKVVTMQLVEVAKELFNKHSS